MSDSRLTAPARWLLRQPVACSWLLVAVLAVASSSIWWFELRTLDPLSSAFSAPWWALLLGAFVAETLVIHLHFRSESGSFSLLEVPLVFGLLFADPAVAVMAMTAGSVVSLAAVRRQPLLKLSFNAANLSLQYAMAMALLPRLLAGLDPLEPTGWPAVTATTSLVALVSFTMILVVIGIAEGEFNFRRSAGAALFALVVAVANTVQALIAVLIMVTEPWAVTLLVLSAALLVVAYRAYLSEREQRERVEFLYTSSRVLGRGGEIGSTVSAFLAEASTIFRADTVVLTWFPDSELATAPARFTQRRSGFDVDIIDQTEVAADVEVAQSLPEPMITRAATAGPAVARWLSDRGIDVAMAGSLQTDRGTIGLVVVADRLGDVASFDETDLRLFSTLVQQVAVSLEKDQLGQALRQLREVGAQLEQQARHDGLTGLANRTTFVRHLDQLDGAGHKELDDLGAVLYIDLDDFKPVNDRYGHAIGDELLRQVAARIQSALRRGDIAARLGGDEFAVLLVPESDEGADRSGRSAGDGESGRSADTIARRLVESLAEPFRIGELEVRIGASVGLARWDGSLTGDELLHHADIALYEAKKGGKGTVVVFGRNLQATVARQEAMRDDLRQAVARGEFEVWYQPIVGIDDLRIVGAEALVRWRHSSGRLVSPADFIAEAEYSGLMSSLDRLVRIEALDQAVACRAIDDRFFVSVNISAQNLLDPGLVDEIASDLAAASAPADVLVCELTESALAARPDAAAMRLRAIRSLGARTALDNYGDGYSSVTALRDLPLEFVKIAKPFVDEISLGNTELMAAMVALGQKLGFVVVAEGVEDDHALTMLRQLQCDLGQGYHFAQPMTAAQLLTMVGRQAVSPA